MRLPIRILHLSTIINRYDFVDNVLRHCDRERFRPFACTFTAQSNIEAPVYTDVPHYVLEVRSRRSYPWAVAMLASILRRERIDIVHTHHFDPMAVGTAAAKLAGCAVIIGRHYSDTIRYLSNPFKRHAYLGAEAIFHNLATRIIVPSAFVYDLLTRVQRVDARKVVKIPYGFDLAKYVPSEGGPVVLRRGFAPDGQVLIGSFGRLHPEKGQGYLLEAARALAPDYPGVRILLVGDGPDRPMLERTARELGLGGRVIFTGWRTDVTDLLAAIDIVVQPSLAETFSQVMVEALASGKPLVMSDVGGSRDTISHGDNGLLVPPGDAEAIEGALRTLLDAPQLARRLGEAGREYVKDTLDIHSIIRQYEECYLATHAESRAA